MKKTRILTIGLLFLFLPVLPVIFSGGRFRSGLELQSGARIARFAVEAGELRGLQAEDILDCNEEEAALIYEFTVTNASEVPVTYQVKLLGGTPGLKGSFDRTGGELSENGGTATVRLTLTPEDPEDRDLPRYYTDLRIVVTAEQKGGRP